MRDFSGGKVEIRKRQNYPMNLVQAIQRNRQNMIFF